MTTQDPSGRAQPSRLSCESVGPGRTASLYPSAPALLIPFARRAHVTEQRLACDQRRVRPPLDSEDSADRYWRMGRVAAVLGSMIFFVVAPGLVAYIVPFLLAQAQPEAWTVNPPVLKWVGLGLGVAGTIALVECFARFAVKGLGTPAPVAPTEHLVSGL